MISTNLAEIRVTRGDDKAFSINFKDSEGLAINLTGWVVWFTVRKSPANASVLNDDDAVISKEYKGDNTGVITVELSNVDTNIPIDNYYYDIQYKKSNGKIRTVGIGQFIIDTDITRAS